MKKIAILFMLGTLLLTTSCSENKEVVSGKYVTEADDTSIEITDDGKVTFSGFDWTLDQEMVEGLTINNMLNSGEIEDTEEDKQKICEAIDVAGVMDGKANTYNTSEKDDGTINVYVDIPNSRSIVSFDYVPSDKSIKYQKLIKEGEKSIGYEEIIYTYSK